MKSPFPGMDPFLEQHWRDVHARLIIYSCDQLQACLPGDLFARVEERVFVESGEGRSMYPDHLHLGSEPVTETYIEIIDASSGNRVITVIEFLSQANKSRGKRQDFYREKHTELRQRQVSLVEIDLLRAGQRVFSVPAHLIPANLRTLYQICVQRGWQTDRFEYYMAPLRHPLPTIRIPLRENGQDVTLNVQAVLDQAYQNARYFQTLNYKDPLDPPLEGDDEAWAEDLLRKVGKR